MTKDKHLISEFILDRIERNLEEAIQEIRQARDAGKSAGKLTKTVYFLALPVRPLRILTKNKIFTIGDLVKQSRQDLLKLKSFGRKSLRYVEESLERKGLSLRFYLIPKESNDQENIRRIKEVE